MLAMIEKMVFDFDDWAKNVITNNVKEEDKINIIENINYDKNFKDCCMLDIYEPKEKTRIKQPVLINYHGGAWVTGDKKWRKGLGVIYANMGLTVITPNYGLSPQYRYMDSLKHCYEVLWWIWNNAKEYGFDLDNIYITGDSAGSQLACMLMAIQNNREVITNVLGKPVCPLHIKSGVLVCGPYDMDVLGKNPLSLNLLCDMTGEKLGEQAKYEYYKYMNNLQWMDNNFPDNVLVAYGRFDFFVGGHEKLISKKLDELGKHYYMYKAKGVGDHCFHLYYQREISQLFFKMVKEYFDKMLDNKENLPIEITEYK